MGLYSLDKYLSFDLRDHLMEGNMRCTRASFPRVALTVLAALLAAGGAIAQTAPLPAPPAAPVDKSGYTLFDPPPDSLLRPFSPDRPTRSTSPVTVDAGHVQIETDLLAYTHSNVGGVSTRLYQAFDPLVKLGVTDRIDIEVQFTGYNWFGVSQPGIAGQLPGQGAGDLYLRSKVNLFGNEGGAALALIPYVKFPTAARNLGNGHTEGGVIAPLSVPLPWEFTLTLAPEVDVLKNQADAGHHFNYTAVIDLGHPIGKDLTVFVELYSATGTDKGTPPVYTFDTALAWAVSDTLQLDVGGNFGLNRNAPNVQLYSGIAKRF